MSPVFGACRHIVKSEWNTGYVGAIVTTNSMAAPINGWNVAWRYTANHITNASHCGNCDASNG